VGDQKNVFALIFISAQFQRLFKPCVEDELVIPFGLLKIHALPLINQLLAGKTVAYTFVLGNQA
jgi:hypothetical protein